MLSIVPTQINVSRRLVVLNHPNSMPAELWRKTLTRTELAGTAPNDVLGGIPTIGGLGVLNNEDEAEVTWAKVGDVKVLFGVVFEGAKEFDNDDGLVPQQMVESQIENVLLPNDPLYLAVDKNDILMVTPGGGIVLPFEVIGEVGLINIPPHTKKFVLNARDDLAYIPGIAASMASRPAA
jgi:hypothetical protein